VNHIILRPGRGLVTRLYSKITSRLNQNLATEVWNKIAMRDRNDLGIDIELSVSVTESEAFALCEAFIRQDCGWLEVGAVFGNQPIFCWAETQEECKAWIDAH